VHAEFIRQVDALVEKGYPALAGLGEPEFRRGLAPLGERMGELPDVTDGRIPFVLVVATVRPEDAIPLVDLRGKPGFTDMADLVRFLPVREVEMPETWAYLLTEVDTGGETLNVTPDDAMGPILAASRSPLTLEEGVAVVTQFPEVIRTRNCFSLLGSRCGDRRVTAIWVSKGRPRLGWCWAGNRHTWLGSASCAGRLEPAS
jgi:hypothetical protein